MKKVLFVDDEPNVLNGLRRMLHVMRNEWDMAFVVGGAEAVAILRDEPFDVVVTDMRMPFMDGAELLTQVRAICPEAVRIILSGQSDQERVLRAVGPAHQFLSKPCEATSVRHAVERACRLTLQLHDVSSRVTAAQIDSLPSLPDAYLNLVQEMELDEPSIARVVKIVARDLGMTAKIMQLVNSSFFGLSQRVSDVAQAVALLGIERIRPLVLSACVFAQFDGEGGSELEAITDHSLVVSETARRIARCEQLPRAVCDDAALAGMLHDIGKLILLSRRGVEYASLLRRCVERSACLCESERSAFGATHAELGAYLLALWGLPHEVVEAVMWHHSPAECEHTEFGPLAIVHAADTWVNSRYGEFTAGESTRFLTSVCGEERLGRWTQMLRRPSAREAVA